MALGEEAADTDGVDHNQDKGTEAADDKGQDVEAEAAGSCRLEDQGGSDTPDGQDPSKKVSFF